MMNVSFTFRNCRDVLSCSFAVDLLNDILTMSVKCPEDIFVKSQDVEKLYKYVHNVNDEYDVNF